MNTLPNPDDFLSGATLTTREEIVRRVRARFAPPQEIRLADWAEAHIVLPAGQSAIPGRYHNWPYLVDILNDIGDPEVETVSLMKAARLGFTKGLVIGIAAKVATDPCSVGLLVPTDDDARDYAVDEIDPLFDATPALSRLVIETKGTMRRKRYKGGASLKILPARAARNLRRHTFKVLYGDEIDAMEITTEGDPLTLAEKRTITFPDRKIVWGSTPTEEDISNIERKYKESDMRVFEIPCPHCETYFELLWKHISWPPGKMDEATAWCPECGAAIDEDGKRDLVEAGRWRSTKPEVKGHHGYKLNALVSLFANTAWPKLAGEYERARRGGPSEEQVFTNTILGEPWRTTLNKLDAETLQERTEKIGLEAIPANVMLLTVGADVQDDRIEATVLGWPIEGSPMVLAHHVIQGDTLGDETWDAFDIWLKRQYEHPNGWAIGIDAAAVDSGGSQGRTQKVYDFCANRGGRRVFAIKGVPGAKPIWARAQKVKGRARLFLVGHDQTKTAVMDRLARDLVDQDGIPDPDAVRLSDDLPEDWFDHVTGEKRSIRYVRNRAIIEFIPKKSGQRTEALDCFCYGWAVRFSPSVKAIDLRERAERKPILREEDKPQPKRKKVVEWSRKLNK